MIQLRIVHQQSECSLVTIQFVGEFLCICQGTVHPVECALHIETGQVGSQLVGIVEYTVGTVDHTRHLLVETSHQGVQLTGRHGEVGCDGLYIVQ